MNQKTYSILFCALLASTLYHELSAKEVLPQRRSALKRHDRSAVESSSCTVECSISLDANIAVFVNASISLVGSVNASAKVALLIDVSANLAALLDANLGVVFLINLSQNVVIKITAGALIWKGGDFGEYFSTLSGLSVYLSAGVSIKVSEVSKADLTIINSIVLLIVADVSAQINLDISFGLTLFISLSAELIVILKANVVLYTVLAVKIFSLSILVGRLKALVILLGNASLQAVLKVAVNFSLAVYLTIESGADAFAYIAANIIVVIGVDKCLSVLENAQLVLLILIKLAGPKEIQIVLVLQVLLILLLGVDVEFSVEALVRIIFILISLASIKTGAIVISVYLNVLLRAAAILKIAVFTGFIQGLIDYSWSYKSLKIGAILAILIGAKLKLDLIITVLLQLTVSVLAVAILLLILIILSTTAIGVSLLGYIGITVVLGVIGIIQATAILAALALAIIGGALSGLLLLILGSVLGILKAVGAPVTEILKQFQLFLKAYFFLTLNLGSSSTEVTIVKTIVAQVQVFISAGGAILFSGCGQLNFAASASGGVAIAF